MTVPSIFDLCKPRDDVAKGTISDSDYAANLANVLTGRASRDYTDAPTFFTNTYPTEGLKELLVNVCGRLSGRGESVSAVFSLDTSFGGGKTHGLIALVHAAAGMKGVSNVAEFLDPTLVPKSSASALPPSTEKTPTLQTVGRWVTVFERTRHGGRSLISLPARLATKLFADRTSSELLQARTRSRSCSAPTLSSSSWTNLANISAACKTWAGVTNSRRSSRRC